MNREPQKVMEDRLGNFLPHPGIQAELMDLYRDDVGVHLSETGNDIFLEGLRQGL